MDNTLKPSVAPQQQIVNSYTTIAFIYCASSSWLFYGPANNTFLGHIHLIAALGVLFNYFLLVLTKNYKRASHIILSMGTLVVVSLFATGGWMGTGYLWPFAYLPYAYFLADKPTSRLWVGILVLADLILLALHIFKIIVIPYSPAALINYFAALSVFNFCMLFYQGAFYKFEQLVKNEASELEVLNAKLSKEISNRKQIEAALNEEINSRKKAESELNERAEMMSKLNDLMVGRELKMVELKEQIKNLKETPKN